MIPACKDGSDGQPVSVDDTIDGVARQALAEARRREELERLRPAQAQREHQREQLSTGEPLSTGWIGDANQGRRRPTKT